MSTELASLYDIEGALVTLMDLRAEAESEGDAEQLAVLDKEIDAWMAQEIRKVDHIAAYIKECERRATIELEEGERHFDRAHTWQARADRVRASALAAMQAHDIKVVETPANTIRRQRNGGLDPIEVTDFEAIPQGLKRITVTLPLVLWKAIVKAGFSDEQIAITRRVEAALDLIRAELREGRKVPGVEKRERGEHLRLE